MNEITFRGYYDNDDGYLDTDEQERSDDDKDLCTS